VLTDDADDCMLSASSHAPVNITSQRADHNTCVLQAPAVRLALRASQHPRSARHRAPLLLALAVRLRVHRHLVALALVLVSKRSLHTLGLRAATAASAPALFQQVHEDGFCYTQLTPPPPAACTPLQLPAVQVCLACQAAPQPLAVVSERAPQRLPACCSVLLLTSAPRKDLVMCITAGGDSTPRARASAGGRGGMASSAPAVCAS